MPAGRKAGTASPRDSEQAFIYAVGSNAINPSRKAAVFVSFFEVEPKNFFRTSLNFSVIMLTL
jgi:stage V sporulation protein SpoVS